MIFKYTKLTINNVSSLTKRNKREKSFLVRILSSMYKRRMKQWPWHWRTNMKESGRLSWNPLQKNESARNALIFFKCVQRAKKEIRCGLKGSWGWTYILILLPIWSVWNEATGFFFFFSLLLFLTRSNCQQHRNLPTATCSTMTKTDNEFTKASSRSSVR